MPLGNAYGLFSSPIANIFRPSTDLARSEQSEAQKECDGESSPEAPAAIDDDCAKPKPSRMDSMEPEELTSDNVSSKHGRRTKVTYSLAHPPPLTISKALYRRQRVLLQLHKLSTTCRPQPDIEAFPATKVNLQSGKIVQLLKPAKDKAGAEDIVFVKAQSNDSSVDVEFTNVVGGIFVNTNESKESKGSIRTQICMYGGQTWEATVKCRGIYEFTTTDSHGLQQKARWVLRTVQRGPRSVAQGGTPPLEERKFIFSTISPGSRRHPVVGTLTQCNLQIFDEYTVPSGPSLSPCPSISNLNPTSTQTTSSPPKSSENNSRVTDESLRNLILVTGSWVAFRENWSPSFRYSQSQLEEPSSPLPRSSTNNSRAGTPTPSKTPDPAASRSSTPTKAGSDDRSPTPEVTKPSRRNSIGRVFHRRTSSLPPLVSVQPPTPLNAQFRRSSGYFDSIDSNKGTPSSNTPTDITPSTTPSVNTPPSSPNLHKEPISNLPNVIPEVVPEDSVIPLKSVPENQETRPTPRAYADPLSTAGIWDSGVRAPKSSSRYQVSINRRRSVHGTTMGNSPTTGKTSSSSSSSSGKLRKVMSFWKVGDKSVAAQA